MELKMRIAIIITVTFCALMTYLARYRLYEEFPAYSGIPFGQTIMPMLVFFAATFVGILVAYLHWWIFIEKGWRRRR